MATSKTNFAKLDRTRRLLVDAANSVECYLPAARKSHIREHALDVARLLAHLLASIQRIDCIVELADIDRRLKALINRPPVA